METVFDQDGLPQKSQQELKKIVEDTYAGLFHLDGSDAAWQAAWDAHKHLIQQKVTAQQRAIMDREFT